MDQLCDAFRHAMRRVAGSVALLTTRHDGRPYGMTMTALMSLSIEPPALAIGVNRGASIAEPLNRIGRFCINLLRENQRTFCAEFSALPTSDRFSIGEWRSDESGLPYLEGAQSNLFCRMGPMLDYGTHRLIVAEVDRVLTEGSVAPLIYVDGRYAAPDAR